MRQEARVIGPVFLILLAGYLAATSFSPFSFLTGGAIVDQSGSSSCDLDHVLFKVSGPGNAHAELWSQQNYHYAVCWDGQGSSARQCSGTNTVVRLSSLTNSHVEKKDGTGNYSQSVCFGDLQCEVKPKGQCSVLGQTWRCVASLSGETNAHVSGCDVYDYDLCCSDGGSGGGTNRLDTDRDTVFDEGLNTTRFTPCNPRTHTDFTICADNCVNIPNPDQADEDGDGAGNVCDDFVNDSCSIRQLNDNCPNLQQCRDLAASWNVHEVLEGEPASLQITGSEECSARIAHFQVFDRDNHNLILTSPQPASFANASGSVSASSSWIGQYFANQSNQYYFQATVTGGTSSLQVTSSLTSLLTVSRQPPGQAVCGNGRVEGSTNETCDDGNIRNGDGCSSNCTFEGSGGPGGRNCRDDSLCRGVPATFMVCQSDPTQAYFCLTGADGCKHLSNPLSCESRNGIQTVCVRGADSCKSPTCNFQYLPGTCSNGQQTITCTATGGSHCVCGSEYPRTLTCENSGGEESFPVFTWFNFIFTIFLLATFYSFRRGSRDALR